MIGGWNVSRTGPIIIGKKNICSRQVPSYSCRYYLATGIDQYRGDCATGLFAANDNSYLASVFAFDCLRLAIAGLLEIKIEPLAIIIAATVPQNRN